MSLFETKISLTIRFETITDTNGNTSVETTWNQLYGGEVTSSIWTRKQIKIYFVRVSDNDIAFTLQLAFNEESFESSIVRQNFDTLPV